jgi:hypothetical protein
MAESSKTEKQALQAALVSIVGAIISSQKELAIIRQVLVHLVTNDEAKARHDLNELLDVDKHFTMPTTALDDLVAWMNFDNN